MAYQSKDLSVLAYANGFTLWHYVTTDSYENVAARKHAVDLVPSNTTPIPCTPYFNPAVDMLRAGDIIIVNTDTNFTPKAGLFLVRQAASGVVDVADMTSGGNAVATA